MLEEYVIKRLSEEDFDQVTVLFNTVFNKDTSKEALISKYSTDFSGFIFICFGAFFKNKLVSFYGSLPHFCKIKGQTHLVAQSSDAMTDPAHLRKGLFLELAKKNFAFCKDVGVKLIYGFPNQNSKPGFVKKMNWCFTDDLVVKIGRAKGLPLLPLGNRLPFLKKSISFYQTQVIKILQVQSRAFISLAAVDNGGVDKSDAFLRYKTKANDSYFVNIKGKLVWLKLSEMFLLVGDVEACSYEEFKVVFKRLKLLASLLGIPHVRFNVSEGCMMEQYLSKLVSADPKSYAVGGLVFDESISLDNFKFTMADNDTF